jgi:AAA family ATP:ADP antiporter
VSKTPANAAEENAGVLCPWLRRLIDMRAPEVPALAWAWLYIFAVLSS